MSELPHVLFQVSVEVVHVTPEMASEMLTHNTHNRGLRNKHVELLRGAIERGEWRMNGDAVRFDIHDKLIDGQHRLWAICLAEKTELYDGTGVDMVVARNLATDAQMTIDSPLRRNLADQLKMDGHTSSTDLAALINIKWKFDNDLVRTALRPTVFQGLQLLAEHPELPESLKVAKRWSRRLSGSTASVAVLYYEFAQRNYDAAGTFFDGVIDGVGLGKRDPRYLLRRHVEKTKVGPLMLIALTIKAWNYYLEGREISALAWRPVGKHAEPFPQIQG